MNINIDYSAKIKSRIYFILIILSFIGPLIFATLMYIYRDSLPIAPPSTNGELLESMINIHKNSTSEKTLKTFSNKKWSLIFVVRGKLKKTLMNFTENSWINSASNRKRKFLNILYIKFLN